jgi:predicted nucleic acid-binding protein
MKVLDTTFLIDFLSGEKSTLKIAESAEELLTTQISMYELIRGILLADNPEKNLLKAKEVLENFKVLALDDYGIIKSAEIFADLAKKGERISDADCMIAGISLSNGQNRIVTRNESHFKRIKGIIVEKY